MDDHVPLVDYDESSQSSFRSNATSNDSFDLVLDDAPGANWTERTDDVGYESVSDMSEPEEIYVDKRYPEPRPPPPIGVPFLQINDEMDAILDVRRRSRRLEDRYHPHSRKLSRGYDDDGRRNTLRNALRTSDLVQGSGTFNGFAHNLEPRRITGAVIKGRQLFYFVEWIGYTNNPFPLEADLMSRHSPAMVMRFHRHMLLNPSTYIKL